MAAILIPSRFGPLLNTVATTTNNLDSDDEGSATLFVAPKTGNIDRIGVFCTAEGGTSADLFCVRLETVSSGLPSGTLVGSSTEDPPAESIIDPGNELVANTWYSTSLNPSQAVTAGTTYAAIVRDAFEQAPSVTNKATFRDGAGMSFDNDLTGSPSLARMTGGTWARTASAVFGGICPQYDDDTLVPGTFGIKTSGNLYTTFANSANPNTYGNMFQVDWDCDCVGINATVYCANSGTGNYVTLTLNAASDLTTPLATKTFTSEEIGISANSERMFVWGFPAVALTASTNYIVAIKNESATNITVHHWQHATAAHTQVNFGNMYLATRQNTGSWTTDTLSVSPCITPILTNVSVGGAAGMKRVAGMLGGMRG